MSLKHSLEWAGLVRILSAFKLATATPSTQCYPDRGVPSESPQIEHAAAVLCSSRRGRCEWMLPSCWGRGPYCFCSHLSTAGSGCIDSTDPWLCRMCLLTSTISPRNPSHCPPIAFFRSSSLCWSHPQDPPCPSSGLPS